MVILVPVPVLSGYCKASGWPSMIANLEGAIDWLSASKPLVPKVKVDGSE